MSAVVSAPARAISGAAFATLLLIALMMGANHVAARIAFNNGVDVATAAPLMARAGAAIADINRGRARARAGGSGRAGRR